ncbi:spore coat protein [Neobacillus sp. SM06]|uniref:spore coat protein n=1 Tax=Neobacillus sp. SM06 TaxID=3422492 RepID=UPI003D27B422
MVRRTCRAGDVGSELVCPSQYRERRWSALDPEREHPMAEFCANHAPTEQANQTQVMNQLSQEWILIKDSCDVTVNTTDTKAALSLQAALQAAILVVVRLSIADGQMAEQITQELLQSSQVQQVTLQKTIIENSKNVNVTTTDTQIALNIQVLLQLLLALVVELEVL